MLNFFIQILSRVSFPHMRDLVHTVMPAVKLHVGILSTNWRRSICCRISVIDICAFQQFPRDSTTVVQW